jgi:hypothetical protein
LEKLVRATGDLAADIKLTEKWMQDPIFFNAGGLSGTRVVVPCFTVGGPRNDVVPDMRVHTTIVYPS